MRDTGLDELELDGANAAVVHVRRCDAMGASVGVSYGDIGNAVDAEGIVERAVLAQDAAVAVGGVFAEADVCNNEEVGETGTEQADGGDDGAAGVVGGGAKGVFGVGGYGNTKEDDGAEAFADKRFEVRDYFVDATAGLVGERGDQSFFVVLVRDKKGVDEHGLGGIVSD